MNRDLHAAVLRDAAQDFLRGRRSAFASEVEQQLIDYMESETMKRPYIPEGCRNPQGRDDGSLDAASGVIYVLICALSVYVVLVLSWLAWR